MSDKEWRSKPHVFEPIEFLVEAMKVTHSNALEASVWCGGWVNARKPGLRLVFDDSPKQYEEKFPEIFIPSAEGVQPVFSNCWVVKDVYGRLTVYTEAEFKLRYRVSKSKSTVEVEDV